MIQQDKELEEYQNQKQEVERLPILKKEDIAKRNLTAEIDTKIIDDVKVNFIKDMTPGLSSI